MWERRSLVCAILSRKQRWMFDIIGDGWGLNRRRWVVIHICERENEAEDRACGSKIARALHRLHLAVNYLDRYLSTNHFDYLSHYLSGHHVEIENLRFVGLTCLMIASKYDGLSDLFLFDAEISFGWTKKYGYQMAPWSFLEHFVLGEREIREVSLECVAMASYFAEVSLFSPRMLPFLPSMVAASSLFLAQYVLEPSKKPQRSALRDCVLALSDCCYGSGSYYLPAITIKYSKKKYYYVALQSSPPSIPLHIFQD
ncbi:cyclin-A1-3-like [Salvia miltiorrhiza]|uniref:cyclin-A1-3-like n=1 Tax=Salvia miltiorrhiza TaxID=226208 RepID=UPI0025AD3AFB|nr:cyclin-A1-3-like [Salvia miltiorrhiza]